MVRSRPALPARTRQRGVGAVRPRASASRSAWATRGSGWVGGAHPLGHGRGDGVGSRSDTFRSLCSWQRSMIGWSNTSVTARRSALAPSSPPAAAGSSPVRGRAARPAGRGPRWRLGRALGQGERDLGAVQGDPEGDHAGVLGHRMPSTSSATRSSPDRSSASSSARACSVAATNRRTPPTWRPRLACAPRADQLRPWWSRRVDSLASIRSRASWSSSEAQANACQVGRGSSAAPSALRPTADRPRPCGRRGDLAGLGAVADHGPVGLWRPLGPTSRSTSASTSSPAPPGQFPRQGRETLAGGAGQLGERHGDPFRQDQLGVGGQGRVRISAVAVPSRRAAWRMPDTYHTAGVRPGPPPRLLGEPRTTSPAPQSTTVPRLQPRPTERASPWRWARHLTAAGGSADRRSAKNAPAPLHQSPEVHHPARPLHPPRGPSAAGCAADWPHEGH